MPTACGTRGVARISGVLIATGLIVAGLPACDARTGSTGDHPRQVTVVGSGQAQGFPDTLTADASIDFVAPDATTAMNQTNERRQAVTTALVDAGVDPTDISTTQVSLQPQYGEGTAASTTITGYRASNTIRVRAAQDSVSQVLAVIVSSGRDATRINSVNYSAEDNSEMVRDARERAFNDAHDRAEQYAKLSGLNLGRVVSISEVAAGTPSSPTPTSRGAVVAPAPAEPGDLGSPPTRWGTVSLSVTVVWELT